ncbi:hypothetical protein LWI28_017790 [Acer negundo]|uniref:Uncharacterized protein n=1 Tax=Acer negundo TaxID=4023 RepID=A0AAD5J648_ACENE|nr:hypothetical protein LWI28_017790 [Acer negundo]
MISQGLPPCEAPTSTPQAATPQTTLPTDVSTTELASPLSSSAVALSQSPGLPPPAVSATAKTVLPTAVHQSSTSGAVPACQSSALESRTLAVVNASEFHLDEPKSRYVSLARIHTSQTLITTSSSSSSSTTIIHGPRPHLISTVIDHAQPAAVVESQHPDSISSTAAMKHNL